jgi:hypothetical protein
MPYPSEQQKWHVRSRVTDDPPHLPIHPTLLTPLLVARSTILCDELREIINESREAIWCSRQVRLLAYPRIRAIAGASDADVGLLIAVMTDAPTCGDCIARKSGVPTQRVEPTLAAVDNTIKIIQSMGPCAACLSITMVFCVANGRGTPRRMRREILSYLEEQRDAAFCASCIASQLAMSNIDVALRQLEGLRVHRRYGRCSQCRQVRLVASAPSSN